MTDIIRYGFVAGEVSESYYGRADLEKYDLALAEAENWFVDYHGGISNTQGTKYVDFIQNAENGFRFFPFKFSNSTFNKYLILMGDGYFRFIQEGAYILEAAKTVSAINYVSSETVITITGHGYQTGDLVRIVTPGQTVEMTAQTYSIVRLTANTFKVLDMFGNDVNYSLFTPYVSGMTIGRVYTVAHDYGANALPDIKMQQIRDVVRITHPSYKVHNLRRYDHDNWTFTIEGFTKPIGRPNNPSGFSQTNPGRYNACYVVAAVNEDGIEGLPSDYGVITGISDLEEVRDSSVTIQWLPVDGASYYNVYRTRIVYVGDMVSYNTSRSYQVGFVGRAKGTHFTDSGVVPDFTKTPQRNINPFARKAIKRINVDNVGTGIDTFATMTVTDATGAGFIGFPIVNGGNVVGFDILDGGSNYTAPTITLSSGSGYAFTVELTDASNNDPATSAVYQQRQLYAGTNLKPLTVFGSSPGKLSDFSVSEILTSSDSFAHEIDSENFSPVRHLIPTRGGVIVMSSGGIWLMSGSNNGIISPTDVQADANVFTGVADVAPLKIDTDILYVSSSGGRVNALSYNDQFKLYSPVDVTILSNHLIEKHSIVRWAYADEPYRLTHAVRSDGVILLFTMIKDQEVYGWTRRVTKGYYKDVLALEGEGNTDVYYAVRRRINGTWVTYIERLVTEKPDMVDDAVYLDCSRSLFKTTPDTTMQLSGYTGTVSVSLADPYFGSEHVGQILRFGKGKGRILSVASPYIATLKVLTDFDQLMNYSNTPREAAANEWTIDAEFSVIPRLYHLEGETVTALADGKVFQNLVVTNGTVTLPEAASRVTIGIPYKSVARSLPLTVSGAVIENKRKRVTSMALRLMETRGLKVGGRKDELYALRTQLAQTLGISSPSYTGISHVTIEPVWSEDAQQYFVQEYPLPATILGYILETDVGDG